MLGKSRRFLRRSLRYVNVTTYSGKRSPLVDAEVPKPAIRVEAFRASRFAFLMLFHLNHHRVIISPKV